MWILFLNDMRSAHVEDVQPVVRAETREELINLIRREQVETYVDDGRWYKSFRKGGPLEWCNKPFTLGAIGTHAHAIRNVGTRQDWMERAGRGYDAMVESVPPAPIAPVDPGEPVRFPRAEEGQDGSQG